MVGSTSSLLKSARTNSKFLTELFDEAPHRLAFDRAGLEHFAGDRGHPFAIMGATENSL